MIGIALFGAGVIGRIHARNVAANPGCALRWVIDQDVGRAEALTSIYGGKPSVNINKALADDGVRAQAVAEAAIISLRQGGMRRIEKIW